MRFGIALASLLYAIYGVLDLWIIPGEHRAVWLIRASVIASCIVALVLMRARSLRKHEFAIGICTYLIIAYGLIWIFSLIPLDTLQLYYVGLILSYIALFSVLSFRFLEGTVIGCLVVFSLLILLVARGCPGPLVFNDMLFSSSSLLLAAIGGYHAERSRRVAFYVKTVIENEREESRRRSLLDPLCGIPNRRFLVQQLDEAILRSRKRARYLAVLFIDVDRFKEINDARGHDQGDEVLRLVSKRLSTLVRAGDTVARLGGDEFVVLLEDLIEPEQAWVFVKRIQHEFGEPVNIHGQSLAISLSIGISVCPSEGESVDTLLRLADSSMYRRKTSASRTPRHRALS